MTRRHVAWACLALILLALPVAGQADGDGRLNGGVLVRVEGDVTIGVNETVEVLVVVGQGSSVVLDGEAGVVVVVGGRLEVNGTIRQQLTLVNAHAVLREGAHVQGDVSRTGSTLEEEPGSRIDGRVTTGPLLRVTPYFGFFAGMVFLIGVPIAFLVTGIFAALIAPRQLRGIGTLITRQFGWTLLGALVYWIGLPLLALLLFFTLIGIPTGFWVLFLALPLLWIAGFIVAATRLGDWLLGMGVRRPVSRHPYLSVLVGVALLFLVMAIPFVGILTGFLAGVLGAGAILVAAWNAVRAQRMRPTAGGPQPWSPSAGGP